MAHWALPAQMTSHSSTPVQSTVQLEPVSQVIWTRRPPLPLAWHTAPGPQVVRQVLFEPQEKSQLQPAVQAGQLPPLQASAQQPEAEQVLQSLLHPQVP